MQYLVTTDLSNIPSTPIAMVDGTVPGYVKRHGDYHFDHHKEGGAEIQIDEIMPWYEPLSDDYTIVTTQVDADACCAAAFLQLYPHISPNDQAKLRAIAFDCDHLQVPDSLAQYADFAAQAVAAMKAENFKLVAELGLPADRKQWNNLAEITYTSAAFKQGTEWLIAAIKGDRKYPGESGEAIEYWQQVEADEQQLIDEGRVIQYGDGIIFNMLGFEGRYVDPRASLRAAKRLGLSASLTLTQRDTNGGWAYTIASKNKGLLKWFNAFQKLTRLEAVKRGIDPALVDLHWGTPIIGNELGFDPWGGREAVGGSGWRTPSLLEPQEVIDALSSPFYI